MVVNVNFANTVDRKDISVSDEATIREVMEQLEVPAASSYMLNGVTLTTADFERSLHDVVEADTYYLRTVKPGDGNR